MASTKVLNCRYPQQSPQCRLICFPWAGGGALFYSNWGRLFSANFEVHGVCLPGRETRFKEANYTRLSEVLDEVVPAVYQLCKDSQFALWGHSQIGPLTVELAVLERLKSPKRFIMALSAGALLNYEVALRLKSQYNLEPVKMFVSGVSAPHSEKRKEKTVDVSKMTDDEFITFLVSLGGTPSELLKNTDIMQMFLPSLRADYAMLKDFGYDHPKDRGVLTCPLDIFDGKDDKEHDLAGWKAITTGRSEIRMMNGGHFYLKEKENTEFLVRHISNSLGSLCIGV